MTAPRDELLDGLGEAGAALANALLDELAGAKLEPDARELDAIIAAARLRDHEVAIRDLLDAEGLTVTTKTGIVRAHPLVAELRQVAVATARILSSVALADTTGGTMKSPRHQRAAQIAWARREAGTDG